MVKLFKEKPSTKYYIEAHNGTLDHTFILPYYFATIEQARSFIISEYYTSKYQTISYTDMGNAFYDDHNTYKIETLVKYKRKR